MTPQEEEIVRARQKSRARLMAILLIAFVILVFAITVVKIQAGMPVRAT